jgi:putative glutamine amidotransferase
MSVRIAIPEPSVDTEYNQRCLPSYISALQSAGATAIIVPLHERPERVARLLASVQGILLPGSLFDVDPQRYGETSIPACGPDDPARTAVDELLLQDAFNLHKPIFGICHGTQTLNVWRNGSLIQDLPSVVGTTVDHSPGRGITDAHPIAITPHSRLEAILGTVKPASLSDKYFPSTAMSAPEPSLSPSKGSRVLDLAKHEPKLVDAHSPAAPSVNSSHHQAIRTAGDNLRVSATSPADGVIEAVELDAPDHYVVAVQWHPERTYITSAFSRALFAAFVHAAEAWQPRRVEESVSTH